MLQLKAGKRNSNFEHCFAVNLLATFAAIFFDLIKLM